MRFGTPLRATSMLMIKSPDVSRGFATAQASSGPIRLQDGTKVPCAETPCVKDPINSKKTKRNL